MQHINECLVIGATGRHAKPTDKLGRRYRDPDTNVFIIADKDDNWYWLT